MRTRRIVAIVLAVIATPALAVGLIDPLEGGLALLGGLAMFGVVWALARVSPPRLFWISLVATVALGIVTLALVLGLRVEDVGTGTGTAGGVLVSVLLWIWRAGALVVLAGGVVYVVRLFRSLRELPTEVGTAS
ncbi:hypothetical protein [Agromyces sp. SYSU T00194]|uniref:hypothetical protein n=1 Tax=Agromyces chitinivorans TaxID=3158560 RepID=UPI0033935D2A